MPGAPGRGRMEEGCGGGPPPSAQLSVVSVLLRFVSCGLLSLAGGFAWWATRGHGKVGVGSALGDILVLLLGFMVGGILWYARDARVRSRGAGRIGDEEIVFSFVVFALMPLAVLVLVGAVWLASLIIGVR